MPNIQRRMWMLPGYDCIAFRPCKFGKETCKPGKGGSHGRHSAELWMAVLGHEAEVLFSAYTMWTPHPLGSVRLGPVGPYGNEIVWHTAWPQEGQTEEDRRETKPDTSCADWSACYQTSTGTPRPDELMQLLVSEGSDAVFKWLENEYHKLVR